MTSGPGGTLDHETAALEMYQLVADLYPICRSITGNGVRETLRIVQKHAPITLHEVPTGTRVLDWTVPKEWNIRDAYVKDARGERVIDFRKSNLHVVSYSVPVRARLSLAELRPRLFTLPDQPALIPYRTSYYEESWGFCLAHDQLARLENGEYDVCIDASLEAGHLSYGECYLAGETDDEVLLSCHVCHPSLGNDNLSGIALAAFLAKELAARRHRHSYRLLFIPGTIGAITWLALNEGAVGRIKHGLVLSGVGDGGAITYKKSRRGDAEIDRAAAHVLRRSGETFQLRDFSPYGYDERQFCSPGFDLPVGCFMRSPHGTYPEYHTSGDDLRFVHPGQLADSLTKCLDILSVVDGNETFVSANPKGEPQLGRRGLYRAVGGERDPGRLQMAMLWVMNQADGRHALVDIADRAGLDFATVRSAADLLCQHGLLRAAGERSPWR
jgi:aminopeptidase-like protein